MIDVHSHTAGPVRDPATDVLDSQVVAPRLSDRRAILETLICSSYPTQILVAVALGLTGMSGLTADGSLNTTFVVTLALADSALVTLLIVWFVRRSGESLRVIFVGARPIRPEVLLGASLVPGVMVGVSLLIAAMRLVTPSWHNVPTNPLTALMADQRAVLLFGFVVVVAGGIREEMQRAFQLHRLTPQVIAPGIALLVTSIAFGLGHTLQGYDVAVGTVALGALWGFMYLRRRSLVAAAVCHALFNLGQVAIAWFAAQAA